VNIASLPVKAARWGDPGARHHWALLPYGAAVAGPGLWLAEAVRDVLDGSRQRGGSLGAVRRTVVLLFVSVLLEGVFDFLAGLLEIGFDLMALTLGFQPVVAGSVTGGFLALTVKFLSGVVDFISQTHGCSPYVGRSPAK
jgi:hypothetical protein